MPWFVFLSAVSSVTTVLTCNKGDLNKVCEIQHTVTENKSCCHCVQPTSRPLQTLDLIFEHVSWSWCMMCQREHWAKTEQNLWVEIQETNMCFQSGHSQHPPGFLFTFTQPLPRRKITSCFSPLTVLDVLVLVVTVQVVFYFSGLFAECLITGDDQIS